MTRDEAIALARDAGFYDGRETTWWCGAENIQRFAALVESLTASLGAALEQTKKQQIGWTILDRDARYMFFPMDELKDAQNYCEGAGQPVPVFADKATLDQHEKDQGL